MQAFRKEKTKRGQGCTGGVIVHIEPVPAGCQLLAHTDISETIDE